MDNLMEYDEEEPIEKRFEDLCQELIIESSIREEAWEKYKDVWTNYAIDGDQIQWLVCSLYECCRKSTSDDIPSHIVENAYVSLTRLLKAAKMSLVQFFHRIKKWAEMTSMNEDMRDRIDRLESQFAVSSVNFKKYTPVFASLFRFTSQTEDDSSSMRRGGVTLKKGCTSADLFHFTWVIFVKVKANFPAICDDLVNSYHLLLCCLDWVYGNVLMAGRKDLVNTDFRGLPRDFQSKDWRPPEISPCVLRAICEENDVNFVECKTIKEYFLKPYLTRLFSKDALKGQEVSLSGVLDAVNFEASSRTMNSLYEEYIMGTGDFDERVFLSDNAAEEIGTSAVHRDCAQVEVLSSDLTPSARRYMQEITTNVTGANSRRSAAVTSTLGGPISRLRGTIGLNNPDARGQNLSQLQGLLMGRSKDASDALIGLLEAHCTPNPLPEIQRRIGDLTDTFCTAYTNGDEVYEDAALTRATLAQTLYFMALENILLEEINKIERRGDPARTGRRVKPDLTGLMNTDRLHRALLAGCLEVVLLSCDTGGRHFPWILEALKLEALHFYKMVEVIIRNVDFPREIVKYLNQVVEHILDTYAWKSDSPLWDTLADFDKAPTIEEVTHPDKIDHDSRSSNNQTSVRKLIMDSTMGGGAINSPTKLSLMNQQRVNKWEGDESARAAASLVGEGQSRGGSVFSVLEDMGGLQPRGVVRHDSTALFFRQVYYLASLRLRDMCDRLNLSKDILSKVWTCFEHALVTQTDLMEDRCLDQLLMCCLYAIARISPTRQITFVDIIQVYRMQPQAFREVYRQVLLDRITPVVASQPVTRTTRHTASPVKKVDATVVPQEAPIEERGDIGQFYNTVFLPKMTDFVKKFTSSFTLTASVANQDLRGAAPTLSPLPIRNVDPVSMAASHAGPSGPGMGPSRRLATNRNIFISPVKSQLHMSPKRVIFSVSSSPSKELREINTMISSAERKIHLANMSLGIKRPIDRLSGLEMVAAKRLNFE